MNAFQIVGLALLECISLFLIVRLWRGSRKMSVFSRCLWSVVLLIPLLGWLFYGFVTINPDKHSDELPERFGGSAPPRS